jgi:hypothetical protein
MTVRNPPEPNATYPLRPTTTAAPAGGEAEKVAAGSQRTSSGPVNMGTISEDPGPSIRKKVHDKKPVVKGTVTPSPHESAAKYSRNALPLIIRLFLTVCSKNVVGSPVLTSDNEFWELLGKSLARGTWKRYESALKLWKIFAGVFSLNWKKFRNSETARFICWCKSDNRLIGKTVKTYLGRLRSLEELRKEIKKGGGGSSGKVPAQGNGKRENQKNQKNQKDGKKSRGFRDVVGRKNGTGTVKFEKGFKAECMGGLPDCVLGSISPWRALSQEKNEIRSAL